MTWQVVRRSVSVYAAGLSLRVVTSCAVGRGKQRYAQFLGRFERAHEAGDRALMRRFPITALECVHRAQADQRALGERLLREAGRES